jgi:hypothetical protein
MYFQWLSFPGHCIEIEKEWIALVLTMLLVLCESTAEFLLQIWRQSSSYTVKQGRQYLSTSVLCDAFSLI